MTGWLALLFMLFMHAESVLTPSLISHIGVTGARVSHNSDVLFIEIEKSKDQMSILEAEKCPLYGFERRFGPSDVENSTCQQSTFEIYKAAAGPGLVRPNGLARVRKERGRRRRRRQQRGRCRGAVRTRHAWLLLGKLDA